MHRRDGTVFRKKAKSTLTVKDGTPLAIINGPTPAEGRHSMALLLGCHCPWGETAAALVGGWDERGSGGHQRSRGDVHQAKAGLGVPEKEARDEGGPRLGQGPEDTDGEHHQQQNGCPGRQRACQGRQRTVLGG